MHQSRHQTTGSPDAGTELGKKSLQSARARSFGKSIRRVQGLEFRAPATSDCDVLEETGSPGITKASISRLHSIAMTRQACTVPSHPPSPFVLFFI